LTPFKWGPKRAFPVIPSQIIILLHTCISWK
jgi:hypothetical protein